MSGPTDHITDGERVVRLSNGHPWLTLVTGGGCALGALMAAFAAVVPDAVIDGISISIPTLVARFKLHQGYRFKDLNSNASERLEDLYPTSGKHETFWVKKLASIEPGTLPYTLSSSSGLAGYAALPMRIPDAVVTFLEDRKEHLSACNLLLAAYGALLARLSGVEMFDVGYTGSELRREIAGLEGFFQTRLPLRVNVDSYQSFTELLRVVQGEVESIRRHKTYAHDLVTRYPQLRATAEAGDKFTLPVTVQSVKRLADHETLSGSDISLVISETESEYLWVHDCERLDVETVAKLASHFTTLLQGIATNPECQIAYLPLLTEAEREQVLVKWNESGTGYEGARSIPEVFEARVAERGEEIAVVYEGEELSYEELDRRANQVGHYLQGLGVGPEARVGLCVERSLEMVIGLMGILKAGGAYVPLDPAYPSERLAYMLEDAEVKVVLTQERLINRLEGDQAQLVCLDRDWEAISRESAGRLKSKVAAENLAYVIYTSGSTGRPKGVEVRHESVVHLIETAQPLFEFAESDVWTVFHSYAFDLSVWEMWTPLLTGGKLVVVPTQVAQSPEDFNDLICEQQVTVLNQTPSAMRQLLEYRKEAGEGAGELSLRLVCCGGEALPREVAAEVLSWDIPLWNFYGPTEATVWAAINRVEQEDLRYSLIPIGSPLPDVQLYILDQHMNPVPQGVAGELCIGGAGLAKGYLKRPELTSERFIPNLFSEAAGSRLYRTGDSARHLADGRIEFIGRLDNQVKVRGFRIELGEIEAVLNSHEQIRESVMVAREGVGGERRLVAYLVGAEPGPSVGELRSYLKASLPDYMVPAAFVRLKELPLTPNGKLDRKALPAPDSEQLELGEEYVRPRTAVEELLAGIWSVVLGLKQVGIDDDFFSLGGHSLLATQIISRIRQTFEVELPLRALFGSPTVAGLAQLIETVRGEHKQIKEAPLVVVSREGDLPLSFAQQRLWFLDKLEPGSATYNVPRVIEIKGALKVEAFSQALNVLVARHESLRTSFETVDGHPRMVIAPKVELALPVVDLSQLAASERQTRVQQLATAEAQLPFDLSRGPLCRVTLLRLGAEEHVVLLTTHHIISDGWSQAVFFKELSEVYEDCINERACSLPELPIQYADFAVWQRQWLQGEILEDQLQYWRGQLQGAPALLELPADHSRPAVQSHRGAHYPVSFSSELLEALKELSRREGVTLYMTLLAAFKTLLFRHTNQEDIVVGSPIANRNRTELEGLIGYFANTLALRTDLSGDPTFRELLGRVREVTLGAYDHQDMPFEKLVEDLQPERSLSYNPLFQVLFGLHNTPAQKPGLSGLTLTPLDCESGVARFDIALDLYESPQGLTGFVEYGTDLFELVTINLIVERLQTLMENIVADPEQRLSTLPLLTEAEREQVLVKWNESGTGYEGARSIPEVFEARVAERGEEIAVVYEGEELSYEELTERANCRALPARTGSGA